MTLHDFLQDTWQATLNLASHNLTPVLYNILLALLIFLVGKWLTGWLTRWMERALERRTEKTVARFVTNFAKVLLYVFVVIAALTQLGIKTTSLVAILGAAGLAVGLSLKDSLSNFAAGVLLVSFRPFRVGDVIGTAGMEGTVREIKIFSTTLVTSDNRVISIPNSQIINGPVINHYAMPTRCIAMVIRVPYSADLSQIKNGLMSILKADQRVLKDPAPLVSVRALADTGVDLNVLPWVKSTDYAATQWDLLEQIKNHFSELALGTPAQKMEVTVVANASSTQGN